MIATGLPQPGPPRRVPLPSAHELHLENGLRVIAVSRAEIPSSVRIPLVSAVISIDRGSVSDPSSGPGVAAMTSALLRQGTKRRTALELDVAVDSIGARLDKAASFDASVSSASATTAVFSQALELLAETVREPAFEQEEFERARARALSDLRLAYSSPTSLARLVTNRVIGGDSPYAHPIAGTPRSLEAMKRDDVLAFHRHAYRPEHATLLIGGDITIEAAFEFAARVFGDWQADPHPLPQSTVAPEPAPRRRVLVVDKPDAGRTAVLVARSAIRRASDAYYAALVTCALLSGYSGRLNQEIRVKRGLSYGAGAQLFARRASGQLVASTLVDHSKAIEAAGVILATLASLEIAPLEERELVARKASLTGSWIRAIETNEGLLSALGDYALYGIPLDELERYSARVEAIGRPEIAAFARRYVVPDSSIVLVGDARAFSGEMPTLADDVRVIPFAELDLDRAV